MASNILSKLLPSANGSPSIYETLRKLDESSETVDVEEREGIALLDEENLRDQTLKFDSALEDAMESQSRLSESVLKDKIATPKARREPSKTRRARWLPRSPGIIEADDLDDDEVPMSLLVEENLNKPAALVSPELLPHARQQVHTSIPALGRRGSSTQAKWQATQEHQQLHQDPAAYRTSTNWSRPANYPLAIIDPKEKAMWRWANVENLDNFFRDVYDYFVGNGIWSILLSRALNLLTLAFVVGFGTFLTTCIDFKKIPGSRSMPEILVPQCTKKMSGFTSLLIWLFAFFWVAKVFQYLFDIRRLKQMHDFYHHVLGIPDTDIQTISWQEVVKRLMSLRDANPSTASGVKERHRRFIGSQSKQRMDAHDIANRLMRRDNYLIALFNKEILDLTLPLPFFKKKQFFSKTLEWNLSLCILDYVFNEQGQVRPLFLKDTHRRLLSAGLRRRFLIVGVMNVICAPFITIYFMMLYFFRYFNEYQKNPSQLGSRQYTPLAEWKFREFNELWHLFQRRVNMSYPFASRYVDQFSKDKTIQLCRFVAFVAGALASVLALASVVDPELFLGFELTSERTVLFYLGVFGTVWAVARGAVPEENLVFDPEYALGNVVEYTHYLPAQWQGRMHSDETRKEFVQLYKLKVFIFLEELLSIIFTPFILWFTLPRCSDRIIDFFREFTLHVDGLGHVCSFAVFDFKKGGNTLVQQQIERGEAGKDPRDGYYSTKDGKMLASYYGFLDNYVTNPKAGAPFLHPSRKRQFHLPPVFPSMISPFMQAEEHEKRSSGYDQPETHQRVISRQGTPSQPGIGPIRTPRFASAGGQHSPVTSILLDPQNQPLPSTLKQLQKASAQSRLRLSRQPEVDLIEDKETVNLDTEEHFDTHASRDAAYDSKLGGSWKTTQASNVNNEDDEDDTRTISGDEGPGVLGLVYQFSKAQAEGRGTGVSI